MRGKGNSVGGGTYGSEQNRKTAQNANPESQKTPRDHDSHPYQRHNVEDECDVQLEVEALVEVVLDGRREGDGGEGCVAVVEGEVVCYQSAREKLGLSGLAGDLLERERETYSTKTAGGK